MSDLEDLGDSEIMQAIARGEVEAFQLLYRRYSPRVFALCLRIVRDRVAAEDVLAETFWQIWHKSDQYDPSKASPLAYLLMVGRSRAIDRRRHLDRRKLPGDGPDVPVDEVSDPADETAPVDELLREEQAMEVRAALEGLDALDRQALELVYYDDLSHKEVAERLNTPLGTIKSRIRRALLRLRHPLRKHD